MEQNNSSRSQGDEKQILVVSSSYKTEDGVAHGIAPGRFYATKTTYRYAEFFMVDLNLGKLVPDFAPSMLQYAAPSSVVSLDNSLYIFGGRAPECEETCHLKLVSQAPKCRQELYVGGSRLCLDLDRDGDGWCSVPKPTDNSHHPRCITLFDKAYVFGIKLGVPEVLDPTAGCWKPLSPPPPELVGCVNSYFPLPDPSNNCIFLYLSRGKLKTPSIYAFTPTDGGGTWKCIADNFFDWTEVAAAVDGVIYFNRNNFGGVVRAFDTETRKWLKVRWASGFEKGVNMNERINYDAFFPLGKNILCLARWSVERAYDDTGRLFSKCSISFRKFRVERRGSTLKLIPLSSPTFVLPGTFKVQAFAPF